MNITRDSFYKGRDVGHAEGRLKLTHENAINRPKDIVIANLVAKYSGLCLEEVQALAATL